MARFMLQEKILVEYSQLHKMKQKFIPTFAILLVVIVLIGGVRQKNLHQKLEWVLHSKMPLN